MSKSVLMRRWNPLIGKAANRFGIPKPWLFAVMQAESGGRTMLGENKPITSTTGAMGLMQLMPATYTELRQQYGLGSNPYDPGDNIIAGAAYLRWLKSKYGYPAMFAAYNDGPGSLAAHARGASPLPEETRNYMNRIGAKLGFAPDAIPNASPLRVLAKFTQMDGSPLWIDITAPDVSVRAAAPGEYGPGVRSVVVAAGQSHPVWENVTMARLIAHRSANPVQFTQADGSALSIDINAAPAVSVRDAAPGEYPPGIRSVVTVGKQRYGVWENTAMARYRIQSHGGVLE